MSIRSTELPKSGEVGYIYKPQPVSFEQIAQHHLPLPTPTITPRLCTAEHTSTSLTFIQMVCFGFGSSALPVCAALIITSPRDDRWKVAPFDSHREPGSHEHVASLEAGKVGRCAMARRGIARSMAVADNMVGPSLGTPAPFLLKEPSSAE